MAVGANSYGTVPAVAALTRRYTTGGNYDASTNPSLQTVENWIDSTSAIVNVALAKHGFKVPVTQEDCKKACADLVVGVVVDLCHAANSAGRFFTERALAAGESPLRAVRREINDWVEDQAQGFEMLGAERDRTLLSGILTRGTDESGDETFPIFQREGFHNEFTNWDQE